MAIWVSGGHLYFSQAIQTFAGDESWTTPALLASETVAGSPTAVTLGNQIYVFAAVGGQLRRWVYNTSSGFWAFNQQQYWSDGTAVATVFGVAPTIGYLSTSQSAELFGIITQQDNTDPSLTMMSFARYNASDDRWYYLWNTLQTLDIVELPALAFTLFDHSTSATDGRFYLYYVPFDPDAGDGRGALRMSLTEGNILTGSTSRRLRFTSDILMTNIWNVPSSAPAVTSNSDENVRAFAVTSSHELWFYPIADGIVRMAMSDENDMDIVSRNICCSLVSGCAQSCGE